MTTEPLVSIVTVCLNAAEYIERCINSVLTQSYKNIEYFIIDGGSTDGTLDIIRKYEQKITYWVSEKDRGIYDAMNKGIALCKGEFIGLLNSDDYYVDDAVQIIIDTVNSNTSVDVIHGNAIVLWNGGHVITSQSHDNLINKMTVNHPTCFIRSEIYSSYKYDIKFKICADYDMMLKLINGGKKFIHVDKVITNYCPYGISTKPSWNIVVDRFRIRSKYNVIIAVTIFIKDTLLYFDALNYYKSNKHKLHYEEISSDNIMNYLRKLLRPIIIVLKKIMS